MAENQWPDFELGPEVRTVRRVLLEEGAGIEEKSHGAIKFRVETLSRGRGGFVHNCLLVAPQLAFRYPLIRVEHGFDQYPVTIFADEYPGDGLPARNEAELKQMLGNIFRSEATKKVVVQLLDLISGHTVA